MSELGYHATRYLKLIKTEGVVKPARLKHVYLFTNPHDAIEYAKEFGYNDVITMVYETASVERKWKPSYAKLGSVIKLKEGHTAKPASQSATPEEGKDSSSSDSLSKMEKNDEKGR